MSRVISEVTISESADVDVTFCFENYEDDIRAWIEYKDSLNPKEMLSNPIIDAILDNYKYGAKNAKETLDEIIQYCNRQDIFLTKRMGANE